MQPNNSNQNNEDDHPELMSFAQRRAMFSQNLADQQSLYNRPTPKRRQSTPCMVPPPEPISRPHVPSPAASIVPPPQDQAAPVSATPPPAQDVKPTVTENAKPVEAPKTEAKEAIPSLSSSFKQPTTTTPLTRTPSSERGQGRVIWVKPDVKPANPLDSRNLTADQILSNDEAFRIARERRKSDSAVLHAQKMALKQSSGDMPKVFIPPPPTSPSPQPAAATTSASPKPTTIPPPQPTTPSPPPVVERSAPVIASPAPTTSTPPPVKQPENDQKPPPSNNVGSTELPKFGSPIKEEPKTQENNNEKEENKPNKDEPVKPQAFKNAFKFFQSLGVTPRRLSDDIGPEQKEISDLQQKIDSTHRKRAFTDNH